MEEKKARRRRERDARRLTMQGRAGHAKDAGRFFDRHALAQIAFDLHYAGNLLQEQFQKDSLEYVQGGFLRCFAALLGLLLGQCRRLAAALLIGYALLLGLLLFLVFQTLAV